MTIISAVVTDRLTAKFTISAANQAIDHRLISSNFATLACECSGCSRAASPAGRFILWRSSPESVASRSLHWLMRRFVQEEVAESLAESAKQSSHRLHAGSAGPSSAWPIVVTPDLPQR